MKFLFCVAFSFKTKFKFYITTQWYSHSYFNRKIMDFPLIHLSKSNAVPRCYANSITSTEEHSSLFEKQKKHDEEASCDLASIVFQCEAPGLLHWLEITSFFLFFSWLSSKGKKNSWRPGGVTRWSSHIPPPHRQQTLLLIPKNPEFHVQTAQTVEFWNWLLVVHRSPQLKFQKFCKLDVKHSHYLKWIT